MSGVLIIGLVFVAGARRRCGGPARRQVCSRGGAVFQRNDLQAIKSSMKKVRQLTGIRLVDHLKEQLLTSATERVDA